MLQLMQFMMDQQRQSMELMQKINMENQQQLMEQFLNSQEEMRKNQDAFQATVLEQVKATAVPPTTIDHCGSLFNEMPTFIYNPDDDTTYEEWFNQYAGAIDTRGSHLKDESKRDMIFKKLDSTAFKMYTDHILPDTFDKFDYKTTVEKLKTLFAPTKSLLRKRFDYLDVRIDQGLECKVALPAVVARIRKNQTTAKMTDINIEELNVITFIRSLQ